MNKIYGMTEEDKINFKKQFNYIVKNSCPIRTRIGNFIGKMIIGSFCIQIKIAHQ